MNGTPSSAGFWQLGILLRGEAQSLRRWIEHSDARRTQPGTRILLANNISVAVSTKPSSKPRAALLFG